MTSEEKQEIISAILSSIRTNSKTITQLTPVTELADADSFEIDGGRRVTYGVLKELIAELFNIDTDDLLAAIALKNLQSVSITAAESTATITITNAGGTSISCSVPVATDEKSGIITAAMKVKIDSAYSNAQSAATLAGTAKGIADAASETAASALAKANANEIALASKANTSDVNTALALKANTSDVETALALKANASDVTTALAGKADKSDLNDVKDVLNFNSVIESATILPNSIAKNSTDEGVEIVYVKSAKQFAAKYNDAYYSNWLDRLLFSDGQSFVPHSGKAFICTSTDVLYHWSTTEEDLTPIGRDFTDDIDDVVEYLSDLADDVDELAGSVAPRLFFNGNVLTDTSGNLTLAQFVALTTGSTYSFVRKKGVVITLSTPDGLKNYQWKGTTWNDVDDWKAFGGSATVGNCYNVTNEASDLLPAGTGYFTLTTAIAAAQTKDVKGVGMQITFASGANTWKTYQYVGADVTDANFTNEANWFDMAGMSAGDESVINVNELCGAPSVGYYTLSSARNAIVLKGTTTGIEYRKSGLVITYMSGENEWETKQFNGVVEDFGNDSMWTDFGDSGETVELSPTPAPATAQNPAKAFSTEGAYEHLPDSVTALTEEEVDALDNTDTENYDYYKFINADGDKIGTAFPLPKGGGGGGSGQVKVTAIAFQQSPIAAAAGSDNFVIHASIRSMVGETAYDIHTIQVVDNSTKQTLMTLTPDQPSSASASDYSFTIDVSPFCKEAGTRYIKIIATDNSDQATQFSRTITVKSVDVTVRTIDNLAANMVSTTDTGKVLTLYQFPNNQGSSIEAKVDIFVNNEWKNLTTVTVRDNSFHAITVNATNIGNDVALSHGSYLMRIQGKDLDSNVTGNIIYTSLLVVNSSSNVPVIALRYNDLSGSGTIKQYETLTMEIAAYVNNSQTVDVTLKKNTATVTTFTAVRNRTYAISQQVQESGDAVSPTALVFQAVSGTAHSGSVTVNVVGSAIDASIYSGALYAFDFATRSNSESDHSITNNGKTMTVNGANWDSNGFVPYLGTTALRIAENVTASIDHAPFSDAALKANGMGIQFAFAARHIADDSAKLISCYDPSSGAGFYVSGSKIAIFCNAGSPQLVERGYSVGEKVTVGIVVEPNTNDNIVSQLGVNYALMKLYINGEEAGCIGYNPTTADLTQSNNISFNGTYGDLYLYWFMAWNEAQGINWQQAFHNYLVKCADTEAMIEEYEFEDVYTSVIANGPDRDAIHSRGMPYIIESPFLGSNIESLDGTMSTKDAIFITLRYYDPVRPWRNCIGYGVQKRNQGTTSAKRPVKNARYYFAKKKGMSENGTLVGYDIVNGITQRGSTYQGVHMELMEPNYATDHNVTDAAILADIAITQALIAKNKIRVGASTIPVDLITVKVDYSDSTNANDCAACNLMNATYRMLGSEYMTPAQRYYNGTYKVNDDLTITGLNLNHSTANHPVATYRSLTEAINAPYFYAKGNWKEDKGEQVALGFKDTPGYNKGCLNYGDFVEFIGTSSESLSDTVTRFLAAGTSKDESKIYLISQYCGSSYKFYRCVEGTWTDTTGSIQQVNGAWTITGDVLNPVEGFELLTYQGLCWWKGVSSVADMMDTSLEDKSSWVQKLIDGGKVQASEVPQWTRYFECMVDDDNLALAYAKGQKVPYFLYRLLCFCQSVDYSTVAEVTWKANWRANAYKYMNVKALMVYYLFTDYLAAVDQQAKNMQPMFFLDEGGAVINGVYNDEKYMRMYPNKVYDADTLMGKDNDGGDTIDPEVDEMKAENFNDLNPFMGYGSVLWQDLAKQTEMVYNASGNVITLYQVASLMRGGTTVVDDKTLSPFSPDGCKYFFLDKIVKKWQKTVSSFDGENKFIKSEIDPASGSSSPYFYALHGLRLTALPSFIEKRFAFRDAYYHCGSFTSGVIGGRINAPDNAKIRITAAKDGFFAFGNDAGGSVSGSVYLEAGDSYEFNVGTQNSGKLLYIYQAHRLKAIDLSELSLDSTWGFGTCELIESLKIGSNSHSEMGMSVGTALTSPVIGELPFLKEIDIRNTSITSLDLGGCPRLEEVLASGTSLTTLTLAQTSPIDTLTLPATMTSLNFINLPSLSYPASAGVGLTLNGATAIVTLRIEGSPYINAATLLKAVLTAQTAVNKLSRLRIANQTMKGDGTDLATLITRNVQGLDSAGQAMTKPVIECTYQLTKLYEGSDISAWEAAIYGLTVLTVIDAYINLINEINDESYGGTSEVATVTLSNIDELALTYYNGESYSDYLASYANDNADINDIVTS